MARLTWPQIETRTISQWTRDFRTLYALPDAARQPEEFWSAAMAHVSSMGEAIRRSHYRDLVRSASHAFCWMCCYVGKCNECNDSLFQWQSNLSEIVGLKFPKQCGHCLAKPCRCAPEEVDESKDKDARYSQLLDEMRTGSYVDLYLNNWLYDFWGIYSGQIHLQTLESVGFHLLEETGEEAMAVRNLIQFRGVLQAGVAGIDEGWLKTISSIPGLVKEYSSIMNELKTRSRTTKAKEAFEKIDLTSADPFVIKSRIVKAKMDFVVELADTFSWLCAVQLKLFEILAHEEIGTQLMEEFHIERELTRQYQSVEPGQLLKCSACGKEHCECRFYPAHRAAIVSCGQSENRGQKELR